MFLYRLILILALPVLGIRMLVGLFKGIETTDGLNQRFGGRTPPDTYARILWVHGASLGELTSAKALIFDLLSTIPDIRILVSANSMTGRSLVASWENERVIPTLAPLDNTLFLRRFLKNWRPIAMVSLENEIWPNRILMAKRSGIPVVVVAGRLSEKSAANWARFPNFSSQVMGAIDALFPMDVENGQRIASLGLGAGVLQPAINLKSAVVLPEPDALELSKLSSLFDRKNTILAASTHPGEEEIILQGFAKAFAVQPSLRLILAPRHATRSTEIIDLLRRFKLPFTTRSAGEPPDPDAPVYLADTIGEMALWYRLSSVVILGGSWVDKGGHSPVEAVQFGALVVHGPDVANHRAAYDALTDAQACIPVLDANGIDQFFEQFALDGKDFSEMGEKARKALATLRKNSASTGPVIQKISELTRKF